MLSKLMGLFSADMAIDLGTANTLVYVRGRADQSRIEQRKFYQRKAYVDLKVLCYIAMISMEQKCILPKQYEQTSMQAAEVMKLLAAWSRSDQKRYRG